MSLDGRVCVVTGASSGIGRALAVACARAGAHVWALGRNSERLEPVVRETNGLTGGLTPVVVDLRDEADIESAVRIILAHAESVDVLVHGAGAIARGPVEHATVEELDCQYGVNLRAPFVLTRAFLPALKRARGKIVFVNSTAGRTATPDAALYAATKHALRGFADSLRQEINPDGVRVLSMFPGRTATPMQQSVHEHERRPYSPERLMDPGDVAELVVAVLGAGASVEVTDLMLRPVSKLPDVVER